MAINRDAIYQALLDRFKAKVSTSLVKASSWTRQDLSFDQVSFDSQPSVAVIALRDDAQTNKPYSLPIKHQLWAQLQVYVREKKGSPESPLFAIVDALEAALERKGTSEPGFTAGEFYTTLGGLVRYACFSGPAEFYQGPEGGQAVALITVEMLAIDG